MNKVFFAGALVAATLAPVVAQAQERHGNRDHREWQQGHRQDYRNDHRDGRYNGHQARHHRDHWRAPFAYRSFGVGVVAPRSYWGSSYYYNDWSANRLPRPHRAHYRYVRHYGDLLLINTRNGRVVSVRRNYFG